MQQEPKPGYDAASGVDVAAGSRNASATAGAFPSPPLDWDGRPESARIYLRAMRLREFMALFEQNAQK